MAGLGVPAGKTEVLQGHNGGGHGFSNNRAKLNEFLGFPQRFRPVLDGDFGIMKDRGI